MSVGSPISRLARESLEQVFLNVIPSLPENPVSHLHTLAQVCKYWYTVVLTTPGLWRVVAIDQPLTQQGWVYAKSGTLPLEISCAGTCEGDHEEDVLGRFIAAPERVAALDVCHASLDWVREILQKPLPNLEHFQLDVTDPDVYPAELAMLSAPRLRTLLLDGDVWMKSPVPVLGRLVVLKLDHIAIDRLNTAVDLVNACPALQCLVLKSGFASSGRIVQYAALAPLTHIQEISIINLPCKMFERVLDAIPEGQMLKVLVLSYGNHSALPDPSPSFIRKLLDAAPKYFSTVPVQRFQVSFEHDGGQCHISCESREHCLSVQISQCLMLTGALLQLHSEESGLPAYLGDVGAFEFDLCESGTEWSAPLPESWKDVFQALPGITSLSIDTCGDYARACELVNILVEGTPKDGEGELICPHLKELDISKWVGRPTNMELSRLLQELSQRRESGDGQSVTIDWRPLSPDIEIESGEEDIQDDML